MAHTTEKTRPAGPRVFWIVAVATVLMMSTGLFLVYREAPRAAGAMPVIAELDLGVAASDPDSAVPSIRIPAGATHVSLVVPLADVDEKFDIVMLSPDGSTRPSRATSLDVERGLVRVVLNTKRCSVPGEYVLTVGRSDGTGPQYDYPFRVESTLENR